MTDEKKVQFDFDSSTLLVYIVKKFKVLLIVGIAAFLISTVAAFMITPKYKSTVTMFAASSVSVSKSLLAQSYSTAKGGLLNFGEEEEAEQLLQILNSEELRARIIEKFDLVNHYKIDKNSKYPMTQLGNEFAGNFKFSKTQFMSISIEVFDEDPKLAADMANYAAAMVDTVMNRMHHERAQKALNIVTRELANVQNQMKTLEDSLAVIRKAGVNDYKSMSKVFNEAYAKAMLKNSPSTMQKIEAKLAVLSKYGTPYQSLTFMQEYLSERLSDMQQKYAEAKVDVDQDLPYKYIVDSATPSEKKAKPKRMIIILVSTLSAVFFALLALIILDSVRKALKS
jgi:uncharacterized protein involved in exopolysaccharide biosynthesis